MLGNSPHLQQNIPKHQKISAAARPDRSGESDSRVRGREFWENNLVTSKHLQCCGKTQKLILTGNVST